MFCINCGEEIYLKETIFTVKEGICENCNHYITGKDHGKPSPKMLSAFRRRFQSRYENNVRGLEPLKETLSRMGVNIEHSPHERERPGYIVARKH